MNKLFYLNEFFEIYIYLSISDSKLKLILLQKLPLNDRNKFSQNLSNNIIIYININIYIYNNL